MTYKNYKHISQYTFHKSNCGENHFPVSKLYSKMSYKRLFKSHQSGNTDDPETTDHKFTQIDFGK